MATFGIDVLGTIACGSSIIRLTYEGDRRSATRDRSGPMRPPVPPMMWQPAHGRRSRINRTALVAPKAEIDCR
jgi:hypothetical protein